MRTQLVLTEAVMKEVDARAKKTRTGKLARSAVVQQSLTVYYNILKLTRAQIAHKFSAGETFLLLDVLSRYTTTHLSDHPYLDRYVEAMGSMYPVSVDGLVDKLAALTIVERLAIIDMAEKWLALRKNITMDEIWRS